MGILAQLASSLAATGRPTVGACSQAIPRPNAVGVAHRLRAGSYLGQRIPIFSVRAWALAFGLVFVSSGARAALAAEPTSRAAATQEYDLKAVLLFNFTRFVDWPAGTFASPEAPWVIGIVGRDPFGKVLDDLVRDERQQGRRFVVERFHNVEAATHCHILFVSESEAGNLSRILRVLKDRPILSVGDFEGFAIQGGMIRFKKNPEGKIQLRINLQAVKDGGLSVSAKLLRVAEVVKGPEG